jgi:hypothetical protein
MNPHPIMAIKVQNSTAALPETGLLQTPESLPCHHLKYVAVTHPGADHARCSLICVIKKDTLPYRQKASSLTRQYKFPVNTDHHSYVYKSPGITCLVLANQFAVGLKLFI